MKLPHLLDHLAMSMSVPFTPTTVTAMLTAWIQSLIFVASVCLAMKGVDRTAIVCH